MNVKLHREVTLTVPITVVAEGGEAEPKPERRSKPEPETNADSPSAVVAGDAAAEDAEAVPQGEA